MIKSKKVLLILLLGLFFCPKNVFASSLSICNEGCTYKSFDEFLASYNGDSDISLEFGEGEYKIGSFQNNNIKSITVKGKGTDKTVLTSFEGFGATDKVVVEDVTINGTKAFFSYNTSNVSWKNIIFNMSGDIRSGVMKSDETVITNVIYNITAPLIQDHALFGFYEIKSLNVDGLKINYTSNTLASAGLELRDINTGIINNLDVNNSKYGIGGVNLSKVIVKNSNLVNNNTCSAYLGNEAKYLPYANSLNYNLIFETGNKLNCATASGKDNNILITAENNFVKDPNPVTDDNSCNYGGSFDGLLLGCSYGKVDLLKKYIGVITVLEGESDKLEKAFDKDVPLSSDIKWSSNDGTISIISDGLVHGIKEGKVKITGTDGVNSYEVTVTVIKNPNTNATVYIVVGFLVILLVSTALYLTYRKNNR